VYAGAAREAVFSVPAVIRRVNADFIPLALRAPLVNNPAAVRDRDERWLYERIGRAKLAPQGICVLNSAGQVLAWVQMFDDDQSVLDFLDHGLKRFREQADPMRLVPTERYLKFPSARHEDSRDRTALPVLIADGHARGKRCPAEDGKSKVPPGSMVARLVGRALDARGQPVPDIVKQEHYVEDQFAIPPGMQKALADALAGTGTKRVRLPEEFSKLCAAHAHLGHIDVKPCLCMIKGKAENQGEWKRCTFWARKLAGGKGTTRWQVEGESEVVSAVAINGDGVHDVKLAWEGLLEVTGQRLTRLVLLARGQEKLEFARDNHPLLRRKQAEVANLPAGRPINLACGVRYGILGEPAADEEATAADPAAPAPQEVPREARRHLQEALGPAFIVFRVKVQDELGLSEAQKDKLERHLHERAARTMQFFKKLEGTKPQERPQELGAYRQQAEKELASFLSETLKEGQRARLRQLRLQQEGPFALLGRPDLHRELKITERQREQFMAVIQEMQQKIETVIKEAQPGASPAEIGPRVMKIRQEHEARIMARLSDAQQRQWKKLLGKPLNLED
jgi:hypothetical protein